MSRSGYRVTALIAWRDARRTTWRSVLIAVLVALPIAGLSVSAIVIATGTPTSEEREAGEFGSADLVVDVGRGADPAAIRNALPGGSRLAGIRNFPGTFVEGASFYSLNGTETSVPIDHPPFLGMFAITDGRAPADRGEAALNPWLLEHLGGRIGSEVRLPNGLTVRVTGLVVYSEQLNDQSLVVLGPGTLTGKLARPTRYLIDLPPGVGPGPVADRLSAIHGVQEATSRDQLYTPPSETGAAMATAIAFAVTAVALAATGLIVAAAFVVGTRRRLRTLGLISAAGGSQRHVLASVLFGGASLGALGSLAGVGLAIGAAALGHVWIDRLSNRLTGPLDLPIVPLAGAVVLGTLAATAAALSPARAAARLSTMQALAGRTPPPRRPGRIAALGLVVVVVGCVVTAAATAATSNVLAVGLVLTVAGFLLAVPLVVVAVGRVARRLPFAPRLAGRDIARSARRTGAALAAATIALSAPVATGAITLSQEALDGRTPSLAPDQMSVSWLNRASNGRERDMQAAIARAFPDWIVVADSLALFPADPDRRKPLAPNERIAQAIGPKITVSDGSGGTLPDILSGPLTVGGPDLLRIFHAEAGIPDLLAGRVVAIGAGTVEDGAVTVSNAQGRHAVLHLPAVEAGTTRYESLGYGDPTYVISPATADRLGLVTKMGVSNRTILALAPHEISADETATVRTIVGHDPSAYALTAADLRSRGGDLRLVVEAGGAIFALLIVGIVVALVSAESRRDNAILVSVGADPLTRRRLAGAGAWLLALVAGLLAVPAGWLPAATLQSAEQRGYPIVPPWGAIATAVVVVPLLAGLLAFAASREPKAARLLRPLA